MKKGTKNILAIASISIFSAILMAPIISALPNAMDNPVSVIARDDVDGIDQWGESVEMVLSNGTPVDDTDTGTDIDTDTDVNTDTDTASDSDSGSANDSESGSANDSESGSASD